ncbi:mitochondrial transcription rescue factor 1 [Pholidichthys leucotaenia]
MKGYSFVTGWYTNMPNLVVKALTMRQLGRLNPHHLMATRYSLQQFTLCPRSIHTRQLCGCSLFATSGFHGPAVHSRDALRCWTVHHLRFKSNKKKGTSSRMQGEQVEEEDDDDDDDDKDDEDDDDYEDVDPNFPKDYKDMEKYVQSFRYDVIMKSGLDIARNKIEDAFYDNRLRLNGQKLIKKSKTVKVGDTLDLVLSENNETNTVTLMRVILRRVFSDTSSTEKYKVALRRWKGLELKKEEAFKP